MKKILKFWSYLVAQLMALFVCGMMMTFINDALQSTGFFGDTKRLSKETPGEMGWTTDPWWDWGPRHYWYYWMMVVLFLLVIVRIIMWIDWFWSDRNDKSYN